MNIFSELTIAMPYRIQYNKLTYEQLSPHEKLITHNTDKKSINTG